MNISYSNLCGQAEERLQELHRSAELYAASMARSKTMWGGASIYVIEAPSLHPRWQFWRSPTRTILFEGTRLDGSPYYISQAGVYFVIDHDAGHGEYYRAVPIDQLPISLLEWIEKQPR